jgi:hypothetical protein
MGVKLCLSKPPRVGPSASQAPQPNPDQLAEVVQALSLLQSVMQQPWAQQVFQSFSPVSSEHVEAARGKPASSKPAAGSMSSVAAAVLTPAAPEHAPKPVPAPKPVTPPSEPSAPVATPAANPPTASPPPTVPSDTSTPPETSTGGMVNSSTHRASHARLARRMASLDPAECPHMQQLWAGSRKDRRWGECFI